VVIQRREVCSAVVAVEFGSAGPSREMTSANVQPSMNCIA
jgi:hypothetical protein